MNFDHLPRSIEWVGIEPNRFMRQELRRKAKQLGISITFCNAGENGIDVENESFDVVLCTLVLCSVPDPMQTLWDIRRMLKPGGRFVFIEHVAADPESSLRRWQDRLRPVWEFLADGCCPNRDTEQVLRNSGFTSLHIENFSIAEQAAMPLVRPHIAGTAVK